MLTNVEKRDIISVVTASAVARRIPRSAVTFSIMLEEVEIFSFSFLDNEGGDIMDYLTWQDLVSIAMLVFSVISCFYNKKR